MLHDSSHAAAVLQLWNVPVWILHVFYISYAAVYLVFIKFASQQNLCMPLFLCTEKSLANQMLKETVTEKSLHESFLEKLQNQKK